MVTINGNGLSEAKKGHVKYAKIIKGQFSEEYIVTFNANKGMLTAICSSSYIDSVAGTINVAVIAEEKDSFLVDLPTYTFTTGSKVWFPKEAVSIEA